MGFPYYVVLVVSICIAGLAVLVGVSDNCRMHRLLLVIYIIAVLIVTLLVRTYDAEVKTILNPLSKHLSLSKNFGKYGVGFFSRYERAITEILLNILLFVPLGFLTPAVTESFRRWWRVLILGLGFSLFIECSQLVLHMGCFDTADLLHNTVGSVIGYIVWHRGIRRQTSVF